MKYLLMLTIVLAIPSVSYGEDHQDYIRVTGTFSEEMDSRDYSKERVLKANFQAAVDANSQAKHLARAFGVQLDGIYSIVVLKRKVDTLSKKVAKKLYKTIDGCRYYHKATTKVSFNHVTELDITFKIEEKPWWMQSNPAVEAPKPPWVRGSLNQDGFEGESIFKLSSGTRKRLGRVVIKKQGRKVIDAAEELFHVMVDVGLFDSWMKKDDGLVQEPHIIP